MSDGPLKVPEPTGKIPTTLPEIPFSRNVKTMRTNPNLRPVADHYEWNGSKIGPDGFPEIQAQNAQGIRQQGGFSPKTIFMTLDERRDLVDYIDKDGYILVMNDYWFYSEMFENPNYYRNEVLRRWEDHVAEPEGYTDRGIAKPRKYYGWKPDGTQGGKRYNNVRIRYKDGKISWRWQSLDDDGKFKPEIPKDAGPDGKLWVDFDPGYHFDPANPENERPTSSVGRRTMGKAGTLAVTELLEALSRKYNLADEDGESFRSYYLVKMKGYESEKKSLKVDLEAGEETFTINLAEVLRGVNKPDDLDDPIISCVMWGWLYDATEVDIQGRTATFASYDDALTALKYIARDPEVTPKGFKDPNTQCVSVYINGFATPTIKDDTLPVDWLSKNTCQSSSPKGSYSPRSRTCKTS